MTMNSEVTDYNASTGNRTGEYGGHVDQMPEPTVDTGRRVLDIQTWVVRWLQSNGAIRPWRSCAGSGAGPTGQQAGLPEVRGCAA